MTQTYWAACPIEEIAGKIEEKFKNYRKWLETTGYADRMRTSYRRFYAMDKQGNLRVQRDDNDIARIDVNHFKSFIKRIHIIATENKLAFQPKARNSDAKSQVQSDLGRGACEYYGDEKNMNGLLSGEVLGALTMLVRYIHCPWDDVEGYELSADDQNIVTTGDQKFESFSAFDCASDTAKKKSRWRILRVKELKHDLAALYPEFAEQILASSMVRDEFDIEFNQSRAEDIYVDDADYTYKYVLYHERTPALEHGRWTEICAGQVLRHGPLTYSRVPVVELKAGDFIEQCFADSPAIDLLPLQEAFNALFSGAITNGLNNALQLLYCPDPNLITRKLDSGQILVTAAQPPVPLNLNGQQGGLEKLIDMLNAHAQLLSGINDTARGNPSSNLKSGASLAVVLAQAIQYVAEIQKSYARAAGEVATILLDNLRKFGPEELIGYIVGTSRKGQVKRFKKTDIMDIERVTVDLGNPLTQNYAGRYELAQQWAEKGIMKSPKQIEAFIRTGEIESITEDDFSDMLLIRDENELLRRGQVSPVTFLDNHAEHIIGHKAVLSSPEARSDPGIVLAVRQHIQAHIDEMRLVPPDIAAVISGQPLPPQLPAGGPGMGQGAPGSQQPMPRIAGARLPSAPQAMPPQAQQNYEEALPEEDEMPMAGGFN